MQVGARVFGMTVVAERRSAVALEIQARGIEDRQPDVIEEAAAFGEQSFLDQILVGAGRPRPCWSASSSPSQAIARYR